MSSDGGDAGDEGRSSDIPGTNPDGSPSPADAAGQVVFGVVVHLVDEPPALPTALAGLSAQVSDARMSPSSLDMSLHWPAQARPLSMTGVGATAEVLHGCTGPDPISISMRTCAVGAAIPPGCLSMVVDDIGVGGTFVHPSGKTCDVRGWQGDIFLQSFAGSHSSPPFAEGDVIKGQLRAACWEGDTVLLWIDTTFELNVSRSILTC
jgi:hypothetical protein